MKTATGKWIMLTFNEEHENIVLHALTEYNLKCFDKIGEYESYPNHCEFWCKEKDRAQSALNAAERYMKTKEKL